MKQVTINKDKLIEAITTNRDVHVAEYKVMLEEYMKQAISGATVLLKSLVKGDSSTKLNLDLRKPLNMEQSYTDALDMLQYEEESTVTLTDREFKNLIKDDWEWSNTFAMSKTAYLN